MKKLMLSVGLLTCCLLTSCDQGSGGTTDTLKDKYKDYFPIGATLNYTGVKNDTFKDIIGEFNSMTCENEMKWGSVHSYDSVTKKHSYAYKEADEMVEYAKEHNMKIRGHALVWHQGLGNEEGTTSWVFLDENDETKYATKDVVLQRMRDHIYEVMKHFGDDVYCWDVCNEVIDDNNAVAMYEDKSNVYRASDWYVTCGDEFIMEAFRYAAEVRDELGLKVKLFYNDYEMDNPIKLEKTVEMIKKMKENNVPIDGIGMQSHYDIGNFNMNNFENAIVTYSSLGIDVQITELDVSVYANGSTLDSNPSAWFDYGSDEYYYYTEIQAAIYGRIGEIARKHKDKITGLTFWGVGDEASWLSKYPAGDYRYGRVDFPYLFDTNQDRKTAYERFTNF